MQVKVKKMFDDVELPKYATDGAACFDIKAYNEGGKRAYLWEGHFLTLYTGLMFEIPQGYVMLVFSRSGHGFNNAVRLANCVGVIDSDYRGELKVKLTSDREGVSTMAIEHGDRIAQAMIIPIPKVELVLAEELTSTERGNGGFGSTGVA